MLEEMEYIFILKFYVERHKLKALADTAYETFSLSICLSVSLNFIPYVFLLSLYEVFLLFYALFFFSCNRFLSFSSFKHLASTFSIHIPLFCMYFSLDYIFLSFSPALWKHNFLIFFLSFIFISCFPKYDYFLFFIFYSVSCRLSPLDCIVLLSVRSRYRLVSYARG